MICTKNLVASFKEVPDEWIWMFYCNLWDVPFDGSTYTIHSLFREERTPSMKIYFKGDRYRFTDYGDGSSGDSIDLVKCLALKEGRKINYFHATLRVIENYNNWVLNSGGVCNFKISDFKTQRSYKVKAETRKWNELDKKYWSEYYIGSRLLEQYNVAPLEEFTMIEDDNQFTVRGEYIYGYYNCKMELCKIYQPKVSKRKFIFVKNYLQGEDQLKGRDFLLIQAGLKDIMSFTAMNLKIDCIAPHSENTMIHHTHMKRWLKQYKQVLIMMDNDDAGHLSMEKYIKSYPEIKPVYHCIEDCKDVADIIRKKGVGKSKQYFVPLIDKTLCSEAILVRMCMKQMPLLIAS